MKKLFRTLVVSFQILLILLFLPGWTAGFNFRATSGYVTDGTNETWINGDVDAYPTSKTVDSATFNVGWTGINHDSQRDRDSGVDRRLAGVNQTPNDGTQGEFRVDMPTSGSKIVCIALGDATIDQAYEYAQVKDNTTTLFTVDKSAGVTAPQFWDANGNVWSAAAWPGSQVCQTVTFATTTFKLLLGTPTAQSGSSGIAHISITDVTAGSEDSVLILNMAGG